MDSDGFGSSCKTTWFWIMLCIETSDLSVKSSNFTYLFLFRFFLIYCIYILGLGLAREKKRIILVIYLHPNLIRTIRMMENCSWSLWSLSFAADWSGYSQTRVHGGNSCALMEEKRTPSRTELEHSGIQRDQCCRIKNGLWVVTSPDMHHTDALSLYSEITERTLCCSGLTKPFIYWSTFYSPNFPSTSISILYIPNDTYIAWIMNNLKLMIFRF